MIQRTFDTPEVRHYSNALKVNIIMSTIQEQYNEELNLRLAEWKSSTLEPPFRFAHMRALLAITVVFPIAALITGWFM